LSFSRKTHPLIPKHGVTERRLVYLSATSKEPSEQQLQEISIAKQCARAGLEQAHEEILILREVNFWECLFVVVIVLPAL